MVCLAAGLLTGSTWASLMCLVLRLTAQPFRMGLPLTGIRNLTSASPNEPTVVDRPLLLSNRKKVWVILAVLGTVACGWVSEGAAQPLPPGFSEEVVFSGLSEPTVVQFASDGRVFVAEKGGLIKVFANVSSPAPTIFADLRPNVYDTGKSGLLGMALDPPFPSVPYV